MRKLVQDPDAVGAADVEAVLTEGVPPEAVVDAIQITFLFDMVNHVADALGFDYVIVPEHHSSEMGYDPTPFLALTAIARETKQIGLSTQPLLLPIQHPVEAAEQATRIEPLLADPERNALIVAVAPDDTPIGWVHVRRAEQLEASAAAELGGLVVDETQRSGGLGAALLAAAERWARDHDCQRLVVRSRVSRQRAHRFYRRHGYAMTKTSRVFEKPVR